MKTISNMILSCSIGAIFVFFLMNHKLNSNESLNLIPRHDNNSIEELYFQQEQLSMANKKHIDHLLDEVKRLNNEQRQLKNQPVTPASGGFFDKTSANDNEAQAASQNGLAFKNKIPAEVQFARELPELLHDELTFTSNNDESVQYTEKIRNTISEKIENNHPELDVGGLLCSSEGLCQMEIFNAYGEGIDFINNQYDFMPGYSQATWKVDPNEPSRAVGYFLAGGGGMGFKEFLSRSVDSMPVN